MKIITLNLNGIRSAARKGFFAWMIQQNADVVCLQEVRAHAKDHSDAIFCPQNYKCYFHYPEKKGYSGTAIYSLHEPKNVSLGLGWDIADNEGRYVQLDFEKLSVASLYLPSGTSGEIRQQIKYAFMKQFTLFLEKVAQDKRDFIIAGDFNIAHKNIDIKNWRGNQKHSGFLPEERAWLDFVFDKIGLIDAFRAINQEPDQYTWWSNFGHAYEKNVGWRIDYQIVTQSLKDKIKAASIFKEQRFSDHAPLIIEYDYTIQQKNSVQNFEF